MDNFKESFKYYKTKNPPPDFNKVIDLRNEHIAYNANHVRLKNIHCTYDKYSCLVPVNEWKVYEFLAHRGLIFIKNPFTELGQRYWIVKCLEDYTKKPNKLNIDAHNDLKPDEDWWTVCCSNDTRRKETLQKKLRWATLGYHHDWDTKVYNDQSKNKFPAELNKLCQYILQVLGFTSFEAQAAIVNFYHMDSTLSGHTDHSEHNLDAPLISLSFGQSALFLIGGETKDVVPTPILIRSGDVVVMSKESRLCYHGVPKILPCPEKPWNNVRESSTVQEMYKKYLSDSYWKPFDEYVHSSRINLNVRQVLYDNESCLINYTNR